MINYSDKFSNRVKGLKASAIREIFKLLADPSIISFAGGNPAPEIFPNDELAEIARDVLKNNGAGALQYSITEGYPPLVNWVREYLAKQNIGAEYDSTIIVSGGQQGIELTVKSFLNEGDGIVCEQPSFVGALNCFRSFNNELIGVSMENDGMNMDELEEKLKKHPNIKIVYTIPTFQNPSGITMSLDKRKRLIELAEKFDFIILEDNPYGELRFKGESLPTLKSMDKNGRVIYVGSFSKILSPGLRLGFVCAHEDAVERLVVCKQVSDVHTNILSQIMACEFFAKYPFEQHIQKIKDLYAKRCECMLENIDKYFPDNVSYTRPEGGFFILCTLPEGLDAAAVMKSALEKKVAFVPGASTMIDQTRTYNTFRLNFSMMNEEKIEFGIKVLGDVLKSICK